MNCFYRIYSIRAYIRKFLFEFNDASKRSFIFLCHFAFFSHWLGLAAMQVFYHMETKRSW